MNDDYSVAIPFPPDKMRVCDINKRSILTHPAQKFKKQIREELEMLGHHALMLGDKIKVTLDFYHPKAKHVFSAQEIVDELENSDMIRSTNKIESLVLNYRKSEGKEQVIVTVRPL